MSERDAYILENRIHREFRSSHDLRILMAGMRNGKRWSGDTECYWLDKKDYIIKFITEFIKEKKSIDYKQEMAEFIVPTFFEKDVTREKNLSNKPYAVIGVDPTTGEVVVTFNSVSEATRAGYKNISMVVSSKYDRELSGGLRWFKASEYDENAVRPLKVSKKGNPRAIICVETGERFESIIDAETTLKQRGIGISGSHISSVCKGKRRVAGGFRWRYE